MERATSIVLLCAGQIGYRCLKRVLELGAARVLSVFSYRVEPPQEEYLARIQELGHQYDVPVFEATNVGKEEYRRLWERLKPDYIFAIKWRTMVPQWIVDLPLNGFIIFHA